MNWKHAFRQVDASDSLKAYAEERFGKVGKLLLKESQWQIFYSMGKWDCHVEVVVTNPDSRFKAKAVSDDFYAAVDLAAQKLYRQFSRRKEVLKSRKGLHAPKDWTADLPSESHEEGFAYNQGVYKRSA